MLHVMEAKRKIAIEKRSRPDMGTNSRSYEQVAIARRVDGQKVQEAGRVLANARARIKQAGGVRCSQRFKADAVSANSYLFERSDIRVTKKHGPQRNERSPRQRLSGSRYEGHSKPILKLPTTRLSAVLKELFPADKAPKLVNTILRAQKIGRGPCSNEQDIQTATQIKHDNEQIVENHQRPG